MPQKYGSLQSTKWHQPLVAASAAVASSGVDGIVRSTRNDEIRHDRYRSRQKVPPTVACIIAAVRSGAAPDRPRVRRFWICDTRMQINDVPPTATMIAVSALFMASRRS